MAEHLAFEELAGDGRAVHRHPRALRAGGREVDRARDHFLAGAALAVDEHGRRGRRHLLDGLADLLHGGRVGDEVLEAVAERAGVGRHRGGAADLLLGALEAREHVLHLERLGEVVEDAALHRVDRGLHARVGSEQDDGDVGARRAHLAEERHAVHRLHPEVGDDDVDAAGPDDLQRRGAVLRRLDFIPVRLQQPLHEQQNARFVVDYEYPRHGFGFVLYHKFGCSGECNTKV